MRRYFTRPDRDPLADMRLEPCRYHQSGASVPASWHPQAQILMAEVSTQEELEPRIILNLAAEKVVEKAESTGLIGGETSDEILRAELLHVMIRGWVIPPSLVDREVPPETPSIDQEAMTQALLAVQAAAEMARRQGEILAKSTAVTIAAERARKFGADKAEVEAALAGAPQIHATRKPLPSSAALSLWPFLEPITGRYEMAALVHCVKLAAISSLSTGSGQVEVCGLAGLLIGLNESYGSERSAAIASSVFGIAAGAALKVRSAPEGEGKSLANLVQHLPEIPTPFQSQRLRQEINNWRKEAVSSLESAENHSGAFLGFTQHSPTVAWLAPLSEAVDPASSTDDPISGEMRPECEARLRRALVLEETDFLADRSGSLQALIASDSQAKARITAAISPFLSGTDLHEGAEEGCETPEPKTGGPSVIIDSNNDGITRIEVTPQAPQSGHDQASAAAELLQEALDKIRPEAKN